MGVERLEELGFSLASLLLMGSNNRSLGHWIGVAVVVAVYCRVQSPLGLSTKLSCDAKRTNHMCEHLGQDGPAAYPL